MGDRQPCPDRIFDDLGIGFTMGGVMGSLWNFGKGARNAARGERLAGAITTMKTRGPISGGNFGFWGGLFSTFECALTSFFKEVLNREYYLVAEKAPQKHLVKEFDSLYIRKL